MTNGISFGINQKVAIVALDGAVGRESTVYRWWNWKKFWNKLDRDEVDAAGYKSQSCFGCSRLKGSAENGDKISYRSSSLLHVLHEAYQKKVWNAEGIDPSVGPLLHYWWLYQLIRRRQTTRKTMQKCAAEKHYKGNATSFTEFCVPPVSFYCLYRSWIS